MATDPNYNPKASVFSFSQIGPLSKSTTMTVKIHHFKLKSCLENAALVKVCRHNQESVLTILKVINAEQCPPVTVDYYIFIIIIYLISIRCVIFLGKVG